MAAPSGGLGALRAGLDDKADANGVVCLSAAGSDETMQLLEACPVRGSQRRFRAFHMRMSCTVPPRAPGAASLSYSRARSELLSAAFLDRVDPLEVSNQFRGHPDAVLCLHRHEADLWPGSALA